jgi:hypothetical protein
MHLDFETWKKSEDFPDEPPQAIGTLMSLAPEGVTVEQVFRVYNKHNGNLDAASNALFDGDVGTDYTDEMPALEPATAPRGTLNSPRPRSPFRE